MTSEVIGTLTQAPLILIVIASGFYILKELNKRDHVWREFIMDVAVRHEEALKKLTEGVHEAAVGNKATIAMLAEQVAKNTALVLLHDATVRGVNPETIGTTEEIIDKLLKK